MRFPPFAAPRISDAKKLRIVTLGPGGWEAVVLPGLTATGGALAGTSRRKNGDLGSTQALYSLPKPALAEPGR
jgi:hypothetical protein